MTSVDLDPLEWQRLADDAARDFRNRVESLREEFLPLSPGGSLRVFWARVRELNAEVRTAPAIKLDDKLALQRTINELCERARREQKARSEETKRLRDELAEALTLAEEGVGQSNSVDEVKAVRADLTALRERITPNGTTLAHHERQALWQRWHQINQRAWARLNEIWQANEAALGATLDTAATAIEQGKPREAREQIRQFHGAIAAHECSHRALRALQTRAAALWREADELARRKREAYLATAGQRLGRWRADRARNQRNRVSLVAEMQSTEMRLAGATTDVAAALMRGELEALRKELERLDSNSRALEQRITEMESAVGQV